MRMAVLLPADAEEMGVGHVLFLVVVVMWLLLLSLLLMLISLEKRLQQNEW
jgi:hypothetical protein